MKALKTMGILFTLALVIALVLGLMLPGEIVVNRSVTIETPVSLVFKQVSNASQWAQWSPWAAAGKSSDLIDNSGNERCCWSGAKFVLGDGCVEIIDSEPLRKLETNMKFHKMADGTGEWLFIQQSPQVTEVHWTMRADVSEPVIIGPLMGVAMNGLVGNMLESGLEGLKDASEKPSEIVFQ